jgi:hypothetical protein
LGAVDWAKLAIHKGLTFSEEENEGVASFIESCEEFQVLNSASEAEMLRLVSEIIKGVPSGGSV